MSGDACRALARRIVAGAEVKLFGIVPRPLLEALRTELMTRGSPVSVAIDYYTPPPTERVSAITEHRWQLGHMGIRNIGRGASGRDEHDVQSALFSLPGPFFDCIVVTCDASGRPSVRFVWTPPARDGEDPQPLMLSPDAREAEAIAQQLQLIARDAPPLRLREIMCARTSEHGGRPDVTRFAIAGARAYGDADDADALMRPIAVVVAYAPAPNGTRILLKERTPLIDAGDFGDHCLLGTRVQLSDVARAYGYPVPDLDDHEDLWLAIERPDPFVVSERAFELAAQRELFITCGMEVEDDRLGFCGTYVVDAPAGEQLGVAVFALDLRRDREVDELKASLRRTPPGVLSDVPIDELYRDDRLNLNRFLKEAEDWLTAQVLDRYGRSATERNSAA